MSATILDSDMRELTFDEVDAVTGGFVGVVVAAAAAIAAAAIAAYAVLSSDDCTTTTETKGGKTVSTTVCT